MRAWVAAWLLAGCAIHVDYGRTQFMCTDGVCPDGYQCIDAVCVHPDMSVAPGDMTTPSDLATCGKSGSVSDNFDANVFAGFWREPSMNAVVQNVGGQVVVTLSSPAPAGAFGELQSVQPVDLASSHVFVKVTQATNTSSRARTFLRLRGDETHWLAIVEDDGMLHAEVGGAVVGTPVAYDNVQQRWWQIREQGGTVYFETSVDGATWMPRATTQTTFTSVSIELGADAPIGESSPGSAQLDDLNGGATVTGPTC